MGSNSIWDPIRCIQTPLTPEERVRQALILEMVEELGFPKSLISVEKSLASLPHRPLPGYLDPNRRLDLLVFAKGDGGLRPLLLVECKEKEGGEAAFKQVLGYNDVVGAPFLAVASSKGIKTYWKECGKITTISFLPSYTQLVEKLCHF